MLLRLRLQLVESGERGIYLPNVLAILVQHHHAFVAAGCGEQVGPVENVGAVVITLQHLIHAGFEDGDRKIIDQVGDALSCAQPVVHIRLRQL